MKVPFSLGEVGYFDVVDVDAPQINAALDALQDSIDHVRTVLKGASDV